MVINLPVNGHQNQQSIIREKISAISCRRSLLKTVLFIGKHTHISFIDFPLTLLLLPRSDNDDP
ncbi:hypothetical protein T06_2358 [Trichinella sp. T6]|nr:hypothetical protein T06_2358 [Trichinella sp. T6]